MSSESALALPTGLLQRSTLKATLRQKTTQTTIRPMSPEEFAAICFDEACIAHGLSNKQIAASLGVSESLIARWRAAHAREWPSLLQLVALGPDFLKLLVRSISRRHGLGRLALVDALESLGDVLAMEG